MLISHECPLTLLEQSRSFNDYDYALVHLFSKYPEYYNFFVESRRRGREIILDNSLFELGEAFDTDEFIEWIEKLRPSQYVIPDSWGDKRGTLKKLAEFKTKKIDHKAVKIGVAQGNSSEEVIECFEEMYKDPFVDKIAISFGIPAWHESTSETPFEKLYFQAVARFKVIDYLAANGFTNKKVHLLGVSLPQELLFYNKEKYNFIESVDTSNPVVHGMFEIPYSVAGLTSKQNSKVAENMEIEISGKQMNIIYSNIIGFRKMLEK